MPEFFPWTICASLFTIAVVATISAVRDSHSLKLANEVIDVLKAKIATLEKQADEEASSTAQSGQDGFTKPLNYPRQ